MEIEELQKIWNEQKGETMYAINENVLHQSISRKKNLASMRINIVEISLMTINSTVGIILLLDAIIDKEGVWDFSFSFLMLLTVLFLFFFRRNRQKQEKKYDRSMLGELNHTISNSDSMIQIATIMIKYYLLPVGIFSVIKMMVLGASVEKWLLVIGAYVLAFIIVYWERKVCHIPRKEKLMKLKEKLVE